MVSELRKTGISVVGDVPFGTHLCHFYETKQDLLNTLIPYFKAGLENNEFCVWVVSTPELITVEEAKGALAQAVPDLDRHLSEKNIEILNGVDWYLEENVFNLESVINAWDAKLKRALALRFDGMRVSGDTLWLAEKDCKDFFAYERQLNESITDQPMTVLCTYPLAKSRAVEVLDVVRAHQFATARRQGEWEVIETPKLIQAKTEIKRLNEDLEQRVVERTTELRLANEELRKEMIERKQAEEALGERLRFETLVTELSTAFASLSPNEVDREIDKWLQTLVEFLGVDRASFFQFKEDWTTLYLGHSYTVPGIEPVSLSPIGINEQFPWVTDQLRRGNTIKWSRIPDDLPEQAAKEKKYTATTGAKSVLNIPVLVGGSVICTISFTSIGTYCDWPDTTVARLRLVGEIFAAAVERKRADEERKRTEEALRSGQERYRKLAENFPNGAVITYDRDFRVTFIAGRDLKETGVSVDLFMGKLFEEITPPEVVALVMPHFRASFEGRTEIYECPFPDGRVYFAAVAPLVDENGLISEILVVTQNITKRKQAEEALRASEEQFRQLAENIREVFWLATADMSKTLYISPAYEVVWGQSCANLYREPRSLFDSIHAEDRSRVVDIVERNREQGFEVEYRVVRPEGSIRWIRDRGFPIKDESGHFYRVAGIAEDITERKQAEEQLRRSEGQLAEAQRTAHIGSWSSDLNSNVEIWSDELYRIYGLQPAKVEPTLEIFIELLHPEDRLLLADTIERATRTGKPFDAYLRIFRPDGEQRVIRTRGRNVYDDQGIPIRRSGTAQDVTEYRRAEEAVRSAEQKYRDIFENAGEGIFQSTPDGRYIAANPALARMYGFASPEELIQSCQDISRQVYVDPARREEFKQRIEEQGVARGFEYEAFRKDGSTLWISVNAHAVKDEQGAIQYYEGTGQDITARKIAEHGLRESEERYRELFENAKDATYVHDLDGRYTSVNRAAEKLSGYTRAEILGKTFTNFVSPEEIEKIREQLCRKLVDEGETSYETEVITKDGRRVAVEVSSHIILENGIPVGVQGTARDIAERKAGEEKLKANTDQLRALSARLQSAREEEGTRIAREIHDELGSALSSLKWDLEEMDKIITNPGGNPSIAALHGRLQAPIKLADAAISTIRRIASELRPGILDDLGMSAAIEWQAQQFQARTGIVCYCDCSLEIVEFNKEQSTAVFRILQEALTNVLRHAQATQVDIKVNEEKGYLVLSISDNGKGIAVSENSQQRSLGILGMRERAHLIGGELDIKGIQSKGTVVTVRVPISGQNKTLKMTR